MKDVVFVDYARTAFGSQGGALRTFSGVELAEKCVRGLIEKSGILRRGGEHVIDAVFGGSADRDKLTVAPIRYLTLLLGLSLDTEGHQVEMQCASGIASINHAAWQLALGYSEVAVAGGYESSSTAPCFVNLNVEPYKGLPVEVLRMHLSPFPGQDIDMAAVSDLVAELWSIGRTECDEYAFLSRQRLASAYNAGLIGDEIVEVVIPASRKTPEKRICRDELSNSLFTMEALSGLEAFRAGGVSTVGNFSAPGDGACFVLMMTAEKAGELGYTPIAKWICGSDIGVEPRIAGIGPAYSGIKALKTAGLTPGDIDVWECVEMSAAQNLAVIREIEKQTGAELCRIKWNPNGGSVAIGHPNAASGPRTGIFAMKQLEKTGGRYGLFSSCGRGGQSVTTVIENLRR